jgi:ABC-type uncharacterized transport system substrate-binding protein
MASADVMAITKWSIEFHTRLAMRITKMATMAEISIRGAKPADIPVEQPDQVRFVINLTTAKALGLAIPESFLLRADEVIE